ncbi:MAG: hypothetical protein WBK28_00950 [Minisyncoccia bacterium]
MHTPLHSSLVALILIALLVAVSDPFMVLLSPPVAMACLVGAAALVTLFAGFMLAEKKGDEREESHRAFAGRAGYLAGLLVLTLGLLYEGFVHHEVPLWLALALGAMIVAKLLARFFAQEEK